MLFKVSYGAFAAAAILIPVGGFADFDIVAGVGFLCLVIGAVVLCFAKGYW